MKIGCCINLVDIDIIAALGYDFVDLSGQELAQRTREEVRHYAEKLEALQLPCMALHATVPGYVRLTGPDFSADAVRDYFEKLASKAEPFGLRYIGVGSPNSRSIPEGYDVARADSQMCEALKIAAQAFPDAEILLESLHRGETNYINSYAHACAVARSADTPRIRTVLDVYHFAMCADRVETITESQLAQAAYLHIADPERRAFPSEETNSQFIALTRKILSCVQCDAIAIEAVSSELEKDARIGLAAVKNILM